MQAEKFRRYVESPVLTDISARFDGFEAYDVEPLSLPDLFAERPLILFGKYKGNPTGNITVAGRTASGDFSETININEAESSEEFGALRLLWARNRIMRLSDMNKLAADDDRVKEVTDLGLKYHLMTQYTSFVAVDKIKRADGQLVTVKQPLPLPDGVSDQAVGDVLAAKAQSSGLYRASAPALAPRAETAQAMGGNRLAEEKESDDAMKRAPGLAVIVEEVRGDLQRPVVERILREAVKEAAACGTDASSSGLVTLRLKIAADGKVKSVRVVSSTIGAEAEKCLIDAMAKLVFQTRGNRGGEVLVGVTFS